MAVDVRINSFYAEAVLLLKNAAILRKSFRLVYTKPEAFLYLFIMENTILRTNQQCPKYSSLFRIEEPHGNYTAARHILRIKRSAPLA